MSEERFERNKILSVRLSDEELKRISQVVELQGFDDTSKFVRNLLLVYCDSFMTSYLAKNANKQTD